jgi:D-alanyl-D-alanine carboxypeptidase
MSQTASARTPSRSTLTQNAVGLVLVALAIIGTLVYRSTSSSSSPFSDAHSPGAPRSVPDSASSSAPALSGRPGFDRGVSIAPQAAGAVTEDDGALPDDVTVFDDEYPGVANLDPDLLHALRKAVTDGEDEGFDFHVVSGWRAPRYQDELFREAVWKYGSQEEAARWVATASTSPHVSGDAIDIGPIDAATWLSAHGAQYGLCQIYRNEPWHFELRPASVDRGCPRMYADPSHDPRMRQ